MKGNNQYNVSCKEKVVYYSEMYNPQNLAILCKGRELPKIKLGDCNYYLVLISILIKWQIQKSRKEKHLKKSTQTNKHSKYKGLSEKSLHLVTEM